MISTLVFTVIILCITWFIVWSWKRNNRLPPGPKGLPFFGYYPFLSRKPYVDFAKIAERYGNVFSFRTVGGKLVVVLNGSDTIREVLVKRADEFIGRPEESNLVQWVSDGMGVAQEEGPVWSEHRRFFLQSAKNFGFGKQESEEMIHEEIRTLIKDVKKESGQISNFRLHVAYVVNTVVCQLLFSKKYDKYGGLFEDLANGATYLAEVFSDNRYMLVGIAYRFMIEFFPSTRRIRSARTLYRKIVKEILEEHINSFDPNNLRDYMDSYLHQAYQLEKNGELNHTFTQKRLSSLTLNMIMEGTESVGGTICALLDMASQHPDEQELVQKELDSVVGRERLPSWTDRTKLPYLEAFIQELYRHNMAFFISTHYCNFKETNIQGYRIPQRSIVVANLWTVNNDPTLYPEPTKFITKRFLDKNGKKLKTDGPYPFGIGKRSCIGESLAQMEVFLVIASILQNFTLFPTEKSAFFKAVAR